MKARCGSDLNSQDFWLLLKSTMRSYVSAAIVDIAGSRETQLIEFMVQRL